jgi:hypothetical protein
MDGWMDVRGMVMHIYYETKWNMGYVQIKLPPKNKLQRLLLKVSFSVFSQIFEYLLLKAFSSVMEDNLKFNLSNIV